MLEDSAAILREAVSTQKDANVNPYTAIRQKGRSDHCSQTNRAGEDIGKQSAGDCWRLMSKKVNMIFCFKATGPWSPTDL